MALSYFWPILFPGFYRMTIRVFGAVQSDVLCTTPHFGLVSWCVDFTQERLDSVIRKVETRNAIHTDQTRVIKRHH